MNKHKKNSWFVLPIIVAEVLVVLFLSGTAIHGDMNKQVVVSPSLSTTNQDTTPIITATESHATLTPTVTNTPLTLIPTTSAIPSSQPSNPLNLLALFISVLAIILIAILFFRLVQQYNRLSESVGKLTENQAANLQSAKLLQQESKGLTREISALTQKISSATTTDFINSNQQEVVDDLLSIKKEIDEFRKQYQVSQSKNPLSEITNKLQEIEENIKASQKQFSDTVQKIQIEKSVNITPNFIDQVKEAIRDILIALLGTDFKPILHKEKTGKRFISTTYESELDQIKKLVAEYPNIETGGDLFGFWTHSGSPVIQFVLGPGSKSLHFPTSFYQDEEYLKINGEYLNTKHGLQHIGEWHSHHTMSLNHPSGGDLDTIRSAIQTYDFPRFLLCIANIDSSYGGISIQPYLVEKDVSNYREGTWKVLPGKSPLRDIKGEVPLREPHLNNKPSEYNNKSSSSQSAESNIVDVWYTTPSGKSMLKDLDSLLKRSFRDCEMKRARSGYLYFSISKGDINIKLEFPNNFPQSEAVLTVGEKAISIRLDPDMKSNDIARTIFNHVVKFVGEVKR